MKKSNLKKASILLMTIVLTATMTGCGKEHKGYASIDDVGNKSKEISLDNMPVNGAITVKLDGTDAADYVIYEEGKSFADLNTDCKVRTKVEGYKDAKVSIENDDDSAEQYEEDLVFAGQMGKGQTLDSNDTYITFVYEYQGLKSCSRYVTK